MAILLSSVSVDNATSRPSSPLLGSLEWFSQRLEESQQTARYDDTYIEVMHEAWPIDAGTVELKELASIVANKPEHPRQEEYRQLVRQAEQGPNIWTYRIWYSNESKWRVAIDTTDPSVHFRYMDVAFDGRLIWVLRDQSLSIFDAASMPLDADYSRDIQQRQRLLTRFFTNGLYFGQLDLQPQSSALTGDDWHAAATSTALGRHREYRGQLSPNGREILLLTVIDTGSDLPGADGQRFEYEKWTYNNLVGIQVPTVVNQYSASGNPINRWTLKEFRTATQDEVAALITLPDPVAGQDPLRDIRQVIEVRDARPGRGVVTTPTGEFLNQLPIRETGRVRGRGYTFAWITAGLMLSGLLVVKARNHRTERI